MRERNQEEDRLEEELKASMQNSGLDSFIGEPIRLVVLEKAGSSYKRSEEPWGEFPMYFQGTKEIGIRVTIGNNPSKGYYPLLEGSRGIKQIVTTRDNKIIFENPILERYLSV